MTPTYCYAAKIERLIDADTVDVDLDLGMRVYLRTRLRVAHIDAPERYTPEGRDAIAFAMNLLPSGSGVVVATHKPDKYGRTLAEIALPDGRDYATALVDAGHATAYEGGPR